MHDLGYCLKSRRIYLGHITILFIFHMHAFTVVHNFLIRGLKRVNNNQVILHIRFKKLVIIGVKDSK